MSDYGLPPAPEDEPKAPEDPPPAKRTRSRRLKVTGAVAAAAAVAVGLATAGHVLTRPAAALTPPRSPSALVSAQAPPSGVHLSTGQIATKVDPGIVDINTVIGYGQGRGAGTGMVLTPSGVVLTNNHVIRGASSITARDIGNGRTYTATVVGYDRSGDVAVLQLQGASGLSTVPLGQSSTVASGDGVTALGNALGKGGTPRVARGSVAALDRSITAADPGGVNAERLQGLIMTNAKVLPGDSGGPLVNTAGQVIGMDAAAGPTPSGTAAFAIPIDTALGVANQIERGSSSAAIHVGPTGFLGVQVVPSGGGAGTGMTAPVPRSPVAGATVAGVLPGYPAEKAGLTRGDVITAVDGQRVSSANALTDQLSTYRPGDHLRVAWVDPAGGSHTATIVLAAGPAA